MYKIYKMTSIQRSEISIRTFVYPWFGFLQSHLFILKTIWLSLQTARGKSVKSKGGLGSEIRKLRDVPFCANIEMFQFLSIAETFLLWSNLLCFKVTTLRLFSFFFIFVTSFRQCPYQPLNHNKLMYTVYLLLSRSPFTVLKGSRQKWSLLEERFRII